MLRRVSAVFGLAAFLPAAQTTALAAADTASGTAQNAVAVVYGFVMAFSLALLVGYLLLERKKEIKFVVLYTAVFLSNLGFFLLPLSNTLGMALAANRLSYFGAAYSVLAMLLIVLDVCRIPCGKPLLALLVCVSTGAFLLAASGGIWDWYYAEVSLETVNGISTLEKVYGPLHILYALYLLVYFGVMVASICFAAMRKRAVSNKYAAFLAVIVLGNLVIWFVEQFIDVDFEFLSVSYTATEFFLLLLYSLLRGYGIFSEEAVPPEAPAESGESVLPPDVEEMLTSFAERVKTLTGAEQRILNYYMEGHEIAEIPELAFVSIHTVKKHNRSIYQKLGVASRDELMLYIELFRRFGRLEALTREMERV